MTTEWRHFDRCDPPCRGCLDCIDFLLTSLSNLESTGSVMCWECGHEVNLTMTEKKQWLEEVNVE